MLKVVSPAVSIFNLILLKCEDYLKNIHYPRDPGSPPENGFLEPKKLGISEVIGHPLRIHWQGEPGSLGMVESK